MAEEVRIQLRGLAERLTPDVRTALLRRAAVHAVSIIARRTRQGLDVEGRPFVSYSTDYGTKRAQSGRKSSPVDLTLGGDMLNSMTVLEVTADRALVGFQGSSTPYGFARFRTAKGKLTTRRVKNANGTSVQIRYSLKRYGERSPSETASAIFGKRKLRNASGGAPVANAVKAKAHDAGTKRVPRRHFFGLSPDERREVITEVARTLKLTK